MARLDWQDYEEQAFQHFYDRVMVDLAGKCASKRAAGRAERGMSAYQATIEQMLGHDLIDEIEQELLDARNYIDDYFIQKALRKLTVRA